MRAFIAGSKEAEAANFAKSNASQRRIIRMQAIVSLLLVGIIAGLVGWINQSYVKEQVNWYMTMRPYLVANVWPYVLTPEAERALKPLASFRECAKDCPEMVVIPAGDFMMGSPATEKDRRNNENDGNGRQHKVTIAKAFAVSKYEVTFSDWDACVSVGGCPLEGRATDADWGRGTRPVIYVNWDDAKTYAAWLSKITGNAYRLLTEAEYEYAARAGTTTAYSWGDDIKKDGKAMANCNGCGSQWDNKQTAPMGSFAANAFGLYDMAGNVWEWVKDCYHDNYNGSPADGSAWTTGDCKYRVVRGSSWNLAQVVRSANRGWLTASGRYYSLGFRVGRTLTP
jgi:formylglycine-generating enzyme required for sulfatase activity